MPIPITGVPSHGRPEEASSGQNLDKTGGLDVTDIEDVLFGVSKILSIDQDLAASSGSRLEDTGDRSC